MFHSSPRCRGRGRGGGLAGNRSVTLPIPMDNGANMIPSRCCVIAVDHLGVLLGGSYRSCCIRGPARLLAVRLRYVYHHRRVCLYPPSPPPPLTSLVFLSGGFCGSIFALPSLVLSLAFKPSAGQITPDCNFCFASLHFTPLSSQVRMCSGSQAALLLDLI